jgi:DNA-binding transcriptional ArsR family regulator
MAVESDKAVASTFTSERFDLAKKLKALGNELRLAIVHALLRRPAPHRATVGELIVDVSTDLARPVKRAALANQLYRLCDAEIVEVSPTGGYRMDSQELRRVLDDVARMAKEDPETQ